MPTSLRCSDCEGGNPVSASGVGGGGFWKSDILDWCYFLVNMCSGEKVLLTLVSTRLQGLAKLDCKKKKHKVEMRFKTSGWTIEIEPGER